MKRFWCVILFLTIKAISLAQNEIGNFVLPAEFEKINSIWMTWNTSAFHSEGEPQRIILQMAKEITPFARMNILVLNDSVKTRAIHSMLKFGIDTSMVSFCFYPQQNRFIRDFGPVFLIDNKRTLKGVDFGYNCYGECEPFSTKAARGNLDSTIEKLLGLDIIKTTVNSEGGNREVNGKGTMLSVETVELHRNPGMTKEQLEAEYKRTLGIKKVIWLKNGAINDDKPQNGILPCGIYAGGTGGHIDEICRFVNSNTILLAQQSKKENLCDSIVQINFSRLEENYRILKSVTDQDGKPFNIIRIVTAPFEFDTITIDDSDISFFVGSHKGQVVKALIASSYLNFVIVNELVLIPKYYKKGGLLSIKQKDEEALKTFKKVFQGKKIVQIDVHEFNYGGGGMHCATVHQPSVQKN